MTTHKWLFTSHFRRHAYGWRSDTPIQRLKEAVSEIKQAARKEPVLAAEGAVLLLEKISPALEHVDSSSGALGTAVNRAIASLAPIIAKADVSHTTREQWLERLWQAIQDDQMPYIELLGEHWGELCHAPELASHWADLLQPTLESAWKPMPAGRAYFKGTSACLASLLAANRFSDVLALLDKTPFKWWHYRRWGVKALAALGKKAEAIRYAEDSRGLNDPGWQIAEACETLLLSSGLHDEAYQRYALKANQKATYLATFRAIARKYPSKAPHDILRDLIASTPGDEGKWFAAAKDAGLFDLAIELVHRNPADPRTLARAARDFAESNPDFALSCGMAALHWIALGYGYEITEGDVLEAWAAISLAASESGIDASRIKDQIHEITSGQKSGQQFLRSVLSPQLPV